MEKQESSESYEMPEPETHAEQRLTLQEIF